MTIRIVIGTSDETMVVTPPVAPMKPTVPAQLTQKQKKVKKDDDD